VITYNDGTKQDWELYPADLFPPMGPAPGMQPPFASNDLK
jgi:hypothetical protein